LSATVLGNIATVTRHIIARARMPSQCVFKMFKFSDNAAGKNYSSHTRGSSAGMMR